MKCLWKVDWCKFDRDQNDNNPKRQAAQNKGDFQSQSPSSISPKCSKLKQQKLYFSEAEYRNENIRYRLYFCSCFVAYRSTLKCRFAYLQPRNESKEDVKMDYNRSGWMEYLQGRYCKDNIMAQEREMLR